MPSPAIVSVDDEPEVLRAVERDLRRKYGKDYRILGVDSGSAAVDLLRQKKTRGDSVALLLCDQRMPQMSGLEVLGQSMQLYPQAKRALLTAYADTDAAIAAINTAKVHYYLLKPWDPPEEKLYPVLDDLLDGRRDEIRKLDFRHRAETHHGSANRRGDDDAFGERRIEDAVLAEFIEQAIRDIAVGRPPDKMNCIIPYLARR